MVDSHGPATDSIAHAYDVSRARQLNMSAKETLLLVDDEEGKEDEAWACIDASMEVPTREKATSARPMMEGREISPEDMRE